jgi:hypothetical protein
MLVGYAGGICWWDMLVGYAGGICWWDMLVGCDWEFGHGTEMKLE